MLAPGKSGSLTPIITWRLPRFAYYEQSEAEPVREWPESGPASGRATS
jgi:hypothetical protein